MPCNRPMNLNTNRTVTLDTGDQSVFEFQSASAYNGDDHLKYAENVSAWVKSDYQVTFWFEFGRATDDYSSLPYKSDVITVAAGTSEGLVVPICGGVQRGRLVIDNQSGSTAAITRDVGVFG